MANSGAFPSQVQLKICLTATRFLVLSNEAQTARTCIFGRLEERNLESDTLS